MIELYKIWLSLLFQFLFALTPWHGNLCASVHHCAHESCNKIGHIWRFSITLFHFVDDCVSFSLLCCSPCDLSVLLLTSWLCLYSSSMMTTLCIDEFYSHVWSSYGSQCARIFFSFILLRNKYLFMTATLCASPLNLLQRLCSLIRALFSQLQQQSSCNK